MLRDLSQRGHARGQATTVSDGLLTPLSSRKAACPSSCNCVFDRGQGSEPEHLPPAPASVAASSTQPGWVGHQTTVQPAHQHCWAASSTQRPLQAHQQKACTPMVQAHMSQICRCWLAATHHLHAPVLACTIQAVFEEPLSRCAIHCPLNTHLWSLTAMLLRDGEQPTVSASHTISGRPNSLATALTSDTTRSKSWEWRPPQCAMRSSSCAAPSQETTRARQ